MESLFKVKVGKVRNSTAALIIFFAWYAAASVTVLTVEKNLETAFRLGALVFITVLSFMTVVFLLSRLLKRTDIIDIAWGPALIVTALTSFVSNPFDLVIGMNVQSLVTSLVVVWGLFLSYRLTRRMLQKPEDIRYVTMRKKWKGSEFLNTYFRIFVLQSFLATVIASAIIHINASLPTSIGPIAIIGVIIWVIGFIFEFVSDWQLMRFTNKPANSKKLMTSGLWKYSRHPNYFGEATMWWGIFIIALSTSHGWLTIVGPVVITYLLLFVSGVPLAEKMLEGRPGWKKYRLQTSTFIPLPPLADKH